MHMKRLLFTIGIALFSCLDLAQGAAPERRVTANRLISQHDPAVTVRLPRAARYLGAERWDLYGIADCELHVFVEADSHHTVKRLYWIQFEGYLPSNQHVYDYSADQPVTFAGRPFWKRARAGRTDQPSRAGSDGERVRQMVERAGYTLPAEWMTVRLVHLLGDSKRQELMFIYAEDLKESGYTAAQLESDPAGPWQAVERGLVERAMKRIRLSP